MPSWLFHDTTSRVVTDQPAVCTFMSVSRRGAFMLDGATNTSAIDFESAPRKATVPPSSDSEKLDPIHSSDGASRSMALLVGSRWYRYDHVRCDAAKKMPPCFHATIDGSSSNAVVNASGVPPAAGTVAMTSFE